MKIGFVVSVQLVPPFVDLKTLSSLDFSIIAYMTSLFAACVATTGFAASEPDEIPDVLSVNEPSSPVGDV